ncbi:MAG TPA: hypothetical protein ENK00_00950 [Chromatiales bacterium]|nr:hypothetical protein [Chromatiales bacterium]
MSTQGDPLLREGGVTWLALFASTGTLVCCALPIVLVTLGLGAAVASLTSALPFLIVLSKHKIWVFLFSGVMLVLAGWLLYRPGRSCPTEPARAAACARAQRWNRRVWGVSVAIWCMGFTAAYLALPVRRLLGF